MPELRAATGQRVHAHQLAPFLWSLASIIPSHHHTHVCREGQGGGVFRVLTSLQVPNWIKIQYTAHTLEL